MIVSVALSPSLDITYVVDHLAEGSQVRPSTVRATSGGKAINMARAAHRAGYPVEVLALLGGPTGKAVLNGLASAGIPVARVRHGAETRRCISILSTRTGLLTELYEEAPDIGPRESEALLVAFRSLLMRSPRWVSLSGSVPGPTGADLVARILRLARDHGAQIAVDTHGGALRTAVDASPDLLKINRTEAAAHLGVEESTDLQTMALELINSGCRRVVLTDGQRGSLGVEAVPGGIGSGIAETGPAVWWAGYEGRGGPYTVGSGDSFLGGMVGALDGGASLADALDEATTLAVANTFEPGAASFTGESVERARPAVRVERRVSARSVRPSRA